MYIIDNIDEKIPFSRRHRDDTIREILRADSGYLKDLFFKNEAIVFTTECLAEICRLTAKHKDNWEKPIIKSGQSVFAQLKPYGVPYLFNFNDEKLIAENESRLKEIHKL